MYRSENKRIQEDINKVVHDCADSLQNANFNKYDVIRTFTDREYSEKLAFAAGMTQNQNKIAMSWGDIDSSYTLPAAPENNNKTNIIPLPAKQNTPTIDKKMQDTIRKHLPKGMKVNFDLDSQNISSQLEVDKKKKDSVIVTYNVTGEKPFRIAGNKKQLELNKKYAPAGVKNLRYYDSFLRVQLKKAGLTVPYRIEKMERPIPHAKWASGFFIIDFYDPIVYRVVYTLPPALLIKRLLPYTAMSIFLLLLVSAAFILYHKSYRLQLQTAQFRESLLSNVTHELKTPVASLQLIINSLRNNKESETKQQEYIGFADKELNRMKTLIEKILSFGKLNERQFDLNKEIINVAELIREAIEITSPLVANVCGTINFEQEANPELMGDRILLLNMIVNLVDNALKYSTNKPTIHVTLTADNEFAKISVADNGIGIPPQYHKKIFEPFFRVPTGNKYDTPGHGIGLSFVKQTVRLHKGTIVVNSRKEMGSTFIIRLPLL
ncbi:MAG TPA: HAMP domain-containing sensor histidine kinase [Flavipsychrobacter sp.]|nr:HAMP domain-containing sensor histidine kinase [Flavipsychrobacter sp.]